MYMILGWKVEGSAWLLGVMVAHSGHYSLRGSTSISSKATKTTKCRGNHHPILPRPRVWPSFRSLTDENSNAILLWLLSLCVDRSSWFWIDDTSWSFHNTLRRSRTMKRSERQRKQPISWVRAIEQAEQKLRYVEERGEGPSQTLTLLRSA